MNQQELEDCLNYQNNFEHELNLIGKSKSCLEEYYTMFGVVEFFLENVMETGQPTTFLSILNNLQTYSDISGNLFNENCMNYFQSYFVPTDKIINTLNYNEIDEPFQERYKYVMYALEFVRDNDLLIFEGFES